MFFVGTGCSKQKDQIQQTSNQENQNISINSEITTKNILTEKDFGSFGLLDTIQNKPEYTFEVQINPQLPNYKFHVVSYNTSTLEYGYIEIFNTVNITKPVQIIELYDSSDRFFSDKITTFFTAKDINFDSFSDIGVPIDNGATWISYQYWIFDQETNTFITAPVTDDFKEISSNGLEFDKSKKQITNYSLTAGIGKTKSIYQFENGRLKLLE